MRPRSRKKAQGRICITPLRRFSDGGDGHKYFSNRCKRCEISPPHALSGTLRAGWNATERVPEVGFGCGREEENSQQKGQKTLNRMSHYRYTYKGGPKLE